MYCQSTNVYQSNWGSWGRSRAAKIRKDHTFNIIVPHWSDSMEGSLASTRLFPCLSPLCFRPSSRLDRHNRSIRIQSPGLKLILVSLAGSRAQPKTKYSNLTIYENTVCMLQWVSSVHFDPRDVSACLWEYNHWARSDQSWLWHCN